MSSKSCLDPHSDEAKWAYCPSFGAAVAFAAMFGISTLGHFAQGILHKKGFTWVICMAGIWETLSLSLRSMGAKNPNALSWAISSTLLVLLAPLLINAFVYMVGGRMVYFWLPDRAVWKFKARFFTRIFVWGDVLSFLVQGAGGSMLSSDDPDVAKLGRNIYMGGVGGQQAFILLFTGLMIGFHTKALKSRNKRETSWAPLLYTVYLVLFLITVRVIYRLVEFSSGPEGVIPSHEYFFYIFEATPMVLALSALNAMHPGRYLIGEGSEFAKPIVTKGGRRWWCCGRRRRTKVHPEDSETAPQESEGDRYQELLPVPPAYEEPQDQNHHQNRYYQHSRSSMSDSIEAAERPGNYLLRGDQAAP